MARQDAEVAVDIDNDGADGPAADQGGNLLGRGQVGETRIGSLGRRGGGRPGLGRGSGRARPWALVQPGGAAEHSRLKRLGEVQAAGDAREDHRKIGGAEARSGEDGIGGDALADRGCECRAVVDQLADEGEQAAGAAGLRVGLGGCCGAAAVAGINGTRTQVAVYVKCNSPYQSVILTGYGVELDGRPGPVFP
jgi:hypothetical protein